MSPYMLPGALRLGGSSPNLAWVLVLTTLRHTPSLTKINSGFGFCCDQSLFDSLGKAHVSCNIEATIYLLFCVMFVSSPNKVTSTSHVSRPTVISVHAKKSSGLETIRLRLD